MSTLQQDIYTYTSSEEDDYVFEEQTQKIVEKKSMEKVNEKPVEKVKKKSSKKRHAKLKTDSKTESFSAQLTNFINEW